jgi:5-methylcytosine-specific restriction endonuclease McrA
VLEPAQTDTFNFRFSADRNFKEKFERLAEVLGVENPLKHMAEIFEQAVDISLEKKDPKKKLERRQERERKRNALKGQSRPDEIATDEEKPDAGENIAKSRYIPDEVRERVYVRAGYQCEYCGPDGTRCSSRTGLEIDHERPFAIYRSHDEHHLRLLCGPHNRFQAERVYGVEFIRAKIDEKKRKKISRDVA